MFKYISCIIFTLIFVSCSKNDDSEIAKEETPVDNVSKIGVNFFGAEINSYDEGIGIFEVSDGYVSIEHHNLDYANSQSDGFTNISFRKLDNNLETINEKIYETETHDYLRSVIQANDNFVMLENQSNSDKSYRETYIKMLNDEGEVLNSKLMSSIQGQGAALFNLGNLYFENNIVYASYRSSTSPNTSVLVALDMQLNLVWENTFNNTAQGGKIYVENNGNVYFVTQTTNSSGTYAIPVLNVLDSSDGSLINSYEYPNSEQLYFNTYDVVSKGEFLYLAGEVVFESESGLNAAVLKIKKVSGEQESIEYWDDYGAIFDLEVSGDNLFLNIWNKNLTSTSIIKADDNSNEIWNYTISGNVSKINVKDNGETIFTGRANKPGSTDSTKDVFLGILDLNGELK